MSFATHYNLTIALSIDLRRFSIYLVAAYRQAAPDFDSDLFQLLQAPEQEIVMETALRA